MDGETVCTGSRSSTLQISPSDPHVSLHDSTLDSPTYMPCVGMKPEHSCFKTIKYLE
uniref:Uncharacterized protein n=1 Tax=Arundo donax TaxID=35708 RepID=A0A0A8YWL8_ARUDO